MSLPAISSASVARNASRIPGSFESDHDASHDQHASNASENNDISSPYYSTKSPPIINVGGDSSIGDLSDTNHGNLINNTVLEEQEMNKRLGDFESTFLPEFSHLATSQRGDVSTFGVDTYESTSGVPHSSVHNDRAVSANQSYGSVVHLPSPKTPPETYKTPAPEQQMTHQVKTESDLDHTPNMPNTSALEFLSSSPTAARTVTRVQSMATIGGYETADEQDFPDSPTRKASRHTSDPDATPRKNNSSDNEENPIAKASTRSRLSGDLTPSTSSQRRRPKYLNSRSSYARLSYDSMASSNTEASDATLGADFALQTGGAAPESRLQRKPRMTLSRSTSLGSIVSGISNMSDDESQQKRAAADPELSPLKEESPLQARDRASSNSIIVTPRPSNINLTIPTDTVVANHVRDLEVPGSFARQYRQSQAISPEKPISMAAMTPGTKKGLTLKEHRSTVEKLGKENFDLKMKIHFLDQALQRRSEDGVKEMITENVQLKSDRMRLEKDNHSLRKQIRDLQKKLENANGPRESPNGDPGYATDEERSPTIEEELIYLRERVEISEVEVGKLRRENIVKETEKRRLAEMVRSLGDTRTAGSDVGSREERDMWKDMLESETIAREQSEEDNKKLREEIAKLRQEPVNGPRPKMQRTGRGGSTVSTSSSVEGSGVQRSDALESVRLRHEISELQKMISAQASTLTSRNKEKERLYQEIEDLKIGRMAGIRSVAGDSIFDRSASRARSNSRVSTGTRMSRFSESERDQYEARIGELRDEVSQLRLDNQTLQTQLQEAMTELDALDAQAQMDADQFHDDIYVLTQERDQALRDAEEQDMAFQTLKNEAQEEIDGLGDELDAKVEECLRLQADLKVQAEDVTALQNEMRSASEGLVRLEEDAQQNLSRYQAVKTELDETNRQLANMQKNMAEAESKIQRFTVQQESSHNEIAFLREEQDGDKIKIGDLESLLKKVHLNLDSERDRGKDLDRRLREERSSREAVSSQEKQEVQRVIDDLNREASNARDELRKIRKIMASKDIEVTSYRNRLSDLEGGLRNVLGDVGASQSSVIGIVSQMQKDLQQATVELDQTSKRLDESQGLLASRNALLESSSFECRKMADMLEKERQGRRQDKHSFEQSLRSHQEATRALSTNNTRLIELETARKGHRKQLSQLEVQYKDQLAERNQILLNIWKKLSALCGPDWAHNHSLINGNLPSQEVIGNMLFWPGFSRNLLLAAKQVEGTFSGLREKIKTVEREMWKQCNNLEQVLDNRMKKLERIEEGWEKMKLRQQEMEAGINIVHPHSQNYRGQPAADIQRLRGENRRLKTELQLLQQQNGNAAHARAHHRSASHTSLLSGGAMSHDGAVPTEPTILKGFAGVPSRQSSISRSANNNPTLMRHNSTNVVEHLVAGSRNSFMSHSSSGNDRNSMSDWPGSPERSSKANLMSTAPYVDPQPVSNDQNKPTYATHSVQTFPTQSSSYASVNSHRPQTAVSNSSDAATLTTAALMSMNASDSSKWIHRLRELERRLKNEREQRLVDRTGMRKRLEERDAVTEELRRELERERIRKGFEEDDNANAGGHRGDIRESVEVDAGERSHSGDRGSRIGIPSVNNRVVEVEGSPVRGRR